MKLIATEDGFLLETENDFDVMALNHWRGRKSTLMMETYKRDEVRFGETAHASGFLRVDFEGLSVSKQKSEPVIK